MNVVPEGVRTATSAFPILLRCVALAYLAVILSMATWTFLPLIANWQPTVVLTGSMRPTIEPGDVILFEPVPASDLVPGQVVLVKDPARDGALLSHRFVRFTSTGDLITKGDANSSEDSTPVTPDRLRGRARLLVPYLGRGVLLGDGDWRQPAPWMAALVASAVVVGYTGPGDQMSGRHRPPAGRHRPPGHDNHTPYRPATLPGRRGRHRYPQRTG